MSRRISLLILAVLLGCLAAGVWTASPPSSPSSSHAAPGPKFAPPDGDVYLGVSTDIGRLGLFDASAGVPGHPAIYNQWTMPDGPVQPILANARTRPGMTPMISWNLPLSGGAVTSGRQDSYIRAQADAVKAFGGPVFVRLDWEMNATWYPDWNPPTVSPADFIAAWRHVYQIFQSEGAGNAAFVWCPNLWTGPGNLSPDAWYPGDDYVDWAGVDAYPQSAAASFILGGPGGLNDAAAFAAQHDKPLMIAEWAPALPQPDTAAAMDLIFDFAAAHPRTVKALVYFDFETGGKDYTLADHPTGAAEFRKRVDGVRSFLLSVD